MVKLGSEVADLSDSMRETLNAGFTQLVDRIATLLEQGSADGTVRKFPDTLVTAQMLYAKWLGAAFLSKLSRSQTPLEQALAETTRA
ncbi:TetR family transcriptional regulator C-terminal domain-containing protein [Sulfitobacter brevis]|uniref:TetR family transcriptional regulator C-terminal domain-containing protein n=1 Tax=Sulfitobacter brevis TaxID=74348 RepID=UPI001FE897D8|nr:TetR family transcriptional regulator C-terminal domain-containing protein [Sulfitobacter brevis]